MSAALSSSSCARGCDKCEDQTSQIQLKSIHRYVIVIVHDCSCADCTCLSPVSQPSIAAMPHAITCSFHHTPMVPSYEPEKTLPAATASTRTASSWPSHFLQRAHVICVVAMQAPNVQEKSADATSHSRSGCQNDSNSNELPSAHAIAGISHVCKGRCSSCGDWPAGIHQNIVRT